MLEENNFVWCLKIIDFNKNSGPQNAKLVNER